MVWRLSMHALEAVSNSETRCCLTNTDRTSMAVLRLECCGWKLAGMNSEGRQLGWYGGCADGMVADDHAQVCL